MMIVNWKPRIYDEKSGVQGRLIRNGETFSQNRDRESGAGDRSYA